MTINRNDDYEKLAKLLYPSIEASGNTYYGQTRKLTLDEVFDKNGNGFESHIESIRVPDASSDSGFKYDVLFKWKVGPLSGSLNADTRYNTDTWFAVYEIVQDPITNENITYSGKFNSYEYNTHAVFKRVMSTNGKSPVNLEDDYDGRNFYVAKDGIKNYIYVLLRGRFIENAPEDLNIEGIKLTAKNGPVSIGLRAVGQIDSANYVSFKYKLQNDAAWNSLNLFVDDVSGTTINIQADEYVLIKRLPNEVKDYNTDRYVQFMFERPEGSNGTINVSGNMLYMAKDQSSYSAQLDIFEFAYLFRGCTLLTSAPKLLFTNLNVSCYYNMFRGCSSLEYPPELPATTLAETCYSLMFNSCTSLKCTPILAANDLVDGCYMRMFQGCSNLNYAECYAKVNSESATTYWMDGVFNTGTFITNEDTVLSENSNDGIPAGWNHITQELNPSANGDNVTVLKTNGCDYFGNGRGDVNDSSTLNNMENSFDEHNLHQMNTYNIDGSLNQEVWGYKCFNSPVQFKNGIYGERAKLVTAHETKDTHGNNNWISHDTWDGSKLSTDNASVSVLKTKNVLTNGTITQYDLSGSSTYISAGDIAYSSIGDIYTGDTDNSTYGSMCATAFHTGTSGSGVWTVSDVVLKTCLDNSCYNIIKLSSNKNEYTENSVANNSKIKLESYSNATDYAKILLNYSNTIIGNYNNSNSSYIKITPADGIEIHGDILPASNSVYDLGGLDHSWDNIYANKYYSKSGDKQSVFKCESLETYTIENNVEKLRGQLVCSGFPTTQIGSYTAYGSGVISLNVYGDNSNNSEIRSCFNITANANTGTIAELRVYNSSLYNSQYHSLITMSFDKTNTKYESTINTDNINVCTGHTNKKSFKINVEENVSTIEFGTQSTLADSHMKIKSASLSDSLVDIYDQYSSNSHEYHIDLYNGIYINNSPINYILHSLFISDMSINDGDGDLSAKIGSIFPIGVVPQSNATWSGTRSFAPGDTLTNNDNDIKIFPVMKDDDDTWIQLRYYDDHQPQGIEIDFTSNITVKLLHGIRVNSNGQNNVIAWVQRI
jgi:hypothetical protein